MSRKKKPFNDAARSLDRKGLGTSLGEGDLVKRGFTLMIESLIASPPYNSVEFSAFIDMFSDAYNAEWTAEQVFGRMDPVATFSTTRRAISVSWKIPAYSKEQAKNNLFKVNKLVSFLYPSYNNFYGASTLNMGPLVRIKFGNLIQNATTGKGLLGYVNGHTIDPMIEDGVYMFANGDGGPGHPGVSYFPKTIRLNFEFTVLHEHSLGWGPDGYLRGGRLGFPYASNVPFVSSPIKNPGSGKGSSKSNEPKAVKGATVSNKNPTGEQKVESPPSRPENPGTEPALAAGTQGTAQEGVAPAQTKVNKVRKKTASRNSRKTAAPAASTNTRVSNAAIPAGSGRFMTMGD